MFGRRRTGGSSLTYVRNASGSRKQNQSYIQYQLSRLKPRSDRAGGRGRSNG